MLDEILVKRKRNINVLKKKRGKKVWTDKVSQYWELEELDQDEDVIEWLKPIKCER